MAQVLKQSLKETIVICAKQLFLEKGYEVASMRDIAKASNMTVGNLYRYFKNKEDIKNYILNDTLDELRQLFNKLNYKNISMEARVFNIKANIDDLKHLMSDLSDRLVDIYLNNNVEFRILMEDKELNDKIIEWFSNSISSLINQHYLTSGYSSEKSILAYAYASSILNGLKQIFSLAEDLSGDRLHDLLDIYLNSYIVMLDQDIRNR